MGKRSDFERHPRDYYQTPIEAVYPLIDHLPQEGFTYVEPCAGDGRLISHIHELTDGSGKCIFMGDIEPQHDEIYQCNAFDLDFTPVDFNYIITNPPWDRKFLHPFIDHFLDQEVPMWLLFDADWMHTKQSAVLMTYCAKVVSVGRVKWIEGSRYKGKDNACWYLFDASMAHNKAHTEFYGRMIQ